MSEYHSLLYKWIDGNHLLKIKTHQYVQGKKQFIGRLIKYDVLKQTIIFYEDDHKEVFHFSLTEVELIEPVKT
ncbi:hypothetical protein [Alkalihalobacillus sp. 1P02AB]|uniref:hypothetical protein n=1 Tax=Alkalihalobacillus sp. 1P02AB TaxID=3132260 RepID=UPI0039A5F578